MKNRILLALLTYKTANIIGLIFLSAMLISIIATLVWAFGRSMGFGDEGLYLLSARFPEDILQNVSAVYIYTGFLFRLSNYDPTIFRFIGMVLVIISAIIFWFGFDKFIRFLNSDIVVKYTRAYSLLFVLLGSTLYYQWFFATPNNYTLNAVALNSFSGMLLLGLSILEERGKHASIIFFVFSVVGLSLGLAVFTKFPSGICLTILCFGIVFLWDSITKKKKAIITAAILFGIGVWFSGHFILILPPEPSWRLFKDGWALYQSFGEHVPSNKILLYSKEIIYLFYSAIKEFYPSYLVVGGFFAYSALRGKGDSLREKSNSWFLFFVLTVAASLSVRPAIHIEERNVTDDSIPFYIVFHLACVLLFLSSVCYKSWSSEMFVHGEKSRKKINKNNKMVLWLLILLPIAAAIGTANPIFNVTGFYSVPWFGAIFLLLLILSAGINNSYSWVMPVCILFIGTFTTSQIIQGSIFNPSQIPTNLNQQSVPTIVGFPHKLLKLDAQTHDLIENLSFIARANGFQQGDDIIATNYLPGLVFAMGGRSPGHPAFLSGYKNGENYSRLALGFADITRLRRSLILLNVNTTHAAAILSSRGLKFPDEYKNIGTVNYTSFGAQTSYSLWKPNHE